MHGAALFIRRLLDHPPRGLVLSQALHISEKEVYDRPLYLERSAGTSCWRLLIAPGKSRAAMWRYYRVSGERIGIAVVLG